MQGNFPWSVLKRNVQKLGTMICPVVGKGLSKLGNIYLIEYYSHKNDVSEEHTDEGMIMK